MASIWYPQGVVGLLTGAIDLDTDTVRAQLIDSADYTYDRAHDNYNDIPTAARCTGGGGTLANRTVTVATNVVTFDADDLVLSSVPGGQGSFDRVVIYKDTGVESTSRLICVLDLTSAITPNGGNITIQFDASGIGSITCTSA